MWINSKNILRLSNLSSSRPIIRNSSSTFKSRLPDTAWVQRDQYKWFMPMQTRFKVSVGSRQQKYYSINIASPS